MKLKKILAAIAASAVAVSTMAVSAFSAGAYNAYLGIQSASYTFRNDWNEASYGKGVADDTNGGYYFDRLTGWDGSTPLNKGGNFTDVEFTSDGTYSVKMDGDFDFGDDESLNLLFVSTDIPLTESVSITDVKVIIDGKTKYTFSEAYLAEDVTDYYKPQCINIWNSDIKELFGYMMPSSSVEIQFTVSGLGDGSSAAADTSSSGAAETTTTTAPATGNVPAAVMASVMAVAGVAVVVSRKRK